MNHTLYQLSYFALIFSIFSKKIYLNGNMHYCRGVVHVSPKEPSERMSEAFNLIFINIG